MYGLVRITTIHNLQSQRWSHERLIVRCRLVLSVTPSFGGFCKTNQMSHVASRTFSGDTVIKKSDK